ncbi:MAG: metallophosphoesterase [Paenibacillus sp.]|jgi:hypothetical protein|nr:metallophosphoesterase [Paenibacillus sp.]
MNRNNNYGENDFAIVIIPDTQILAMHHPLIYNTMAQWIVDHAAELNLQMILHLGDVVNNGANSEAQFQAAAEALETIYDAGLPMLVAAGNHDYDNMLAADRSLTMFNRYFGVHRYRDRSWFGGTFEEEMTENCYAKLEIGGIQFLFLSLEFGPRDEVLAWADGMMEAHPDHRVIVMTHSFMHTHGERTKPGDKHNPKNYRGAIGANDGEDVWHKSFKHHSNLIAVFSGHQIPENVSYRMDLGERGNPVFQSFQNWQSGKNGGEGRIRILKFRPSANEMTLLVFNPYTGVYEKNDGYEISVPLNLEQSVDSFRFPK